MKIGIVGLGYVGLPLAVVFAEAGCEVVGVDIDAGRIAGIRDGRSPVEDITDERLAAVLSRCHFTTRYVELHETDAILVCVPTPLTRNREPDLGPLLGASRALAGVIRRGQVVVLESTTFPGTTREHLVPLLEESGLTAGEDFKLAFSPERVDPGRTDFTLKTTPKVVGGYTPACTEAAPWREGYKVTRQPIICECKAHRTQIKPKDVHYFYGKFRIQKSNNRKLKAMFFSTSGFHGTTYETYDDLSIKICTY